MQMLALLLGALAVASAAPAGKPKDNALFGWDRVRASLDLVKDVGTMTATTIHDAIPKEGQDALVKASAATADGWKLYDQHAKEHVNLAHHHITNVASIANEATKDHVSKLNAIIDQAVDRFEKRHPTSKGVVPKDAFDRLCFILYLWMFLNITLKIVKLFFKIPVKTLKILTSPCRGSSDKKSGSKKGSGEPKQSKPKPKMKK